MLEKKVIGYVISINNYNDEHIVIILTESGNKLFLKSKGLNNISSKNRMSLMLLNKCEIEYFTSGNSNSGRIKRSTLIKEYLIDNNKGLLIKDLISNIVNYSNNNTFTMFNSIENIINLLEKNLFEFQNILQILIIFLRQENYYVNVNSCVKCGTNQNIYGFSLFDGGLLCKIHIENKNNIYSPQLLRKIIEINNLKNPNDCKNLEFTLNEVQILKKIYKNFIEENFGINLFWIDNL